MANSTNTRPRRSLFSFTRKRIFDTLSELFTGFTVKTPAPSEVTFCYFGNQRVTLVDNDGPVTIKVWATYKDPTEFEFIGCETRAEVIQVLGKRFSGFRAARIMTGGGK